MKKTYFKKKLSATIISAVTGMSGAAIAQTDNSTQNASGATEQVLVQGIRQALISALDEKRNSKNLVEVIQAEDIGKLPDQNLAEVLENITGIQIDRSSGVGTSVQIRGESKNRVEINGVSTVGVGGERTGISFEDLPAALIASLEVTKVPTAKTIEGSVGGTINLRTLRGNSLKERLVQGRVQFENSDLADSTTPRVSGTFGDNWDLDAGKLGVVVTASHAKLDVASAEPRFDRDRVVTSDSGRASAEEFDFLRTQFLDQPFTAENYTTTNLTTSVEFEPSDELKLYLDVTHNDQERARTSSRAFFSGTGANAVVDNTSEQTFETVDLGSVDGEFGTLDLGSVQVVTSGILGAGYLVDPNNGDPNLRTGNNNGSRLTKSNVIALGTEWEQDKLQIKAELSYSDSKSDDVSLNSSLDFINPRSIQPSPTTSADNATPAIFNISDNTFEFGIAQGLAETPTSQELLDPANYALRGIGQGLLEREGSEKAARVDAVYDISDSVPLFTDLSAGIRWNASNATTNNTTSSNSFGGDWNRPRANLFADIVTPGANNFNGGDDRELFIRDYLIIDNGISFNDPQRVIDTINDAIEANNALQGEQVNGPLSEPTTQISQFFDIDEDTLALYLQGDFEVDAGSVPISGNIGVRYVSTDITSVGASVVNDEVETTTETSGHSFVLPRFNIVADLAENLKLRAGAGKDIRRPDFDDLSTSANFGTSASAPVTVGNPTLIPEENWSYDLSLEYFPSPSSILSAGIFHKERENLITRVRDEPAAPIGESGQVERDVTAPCEEGGIFNPNVPPENYNVFSSRRDTQGICVPRVTRINTSGTASQTGLEVAAQYDLAEWEDTLGWASGFGVIANYTYQKTSDTNDFDIGSAPINQILGRTDTDNSTPTLDDDVVTRRIGLPKLSNRSYNFTLFYDKYDLNVRMRYTYRSAFEERLNVMRFNIPPIVGARGQLNLSVNYQINDIFAVGVEGVNLTREDRTRWCFNEGALLCEQNLTDRRITFGITAKL